LPPLFLVNPIAAAGNHHHRRIIGNPAKNDGFGNLGNAAA
jgi:hypothetical protein